MNNRRTFFKKSLPLALLPILPLTTFATSKANNKDDTDRIIIKPKVIFFDVNETLLDLEPLKESVAKKLGGRKDLGTLWFTTMLQYSLVTTLADEYFDFGTIGAAALMMVARNNAISISEAEAKLTIKPILSLKPHPEVVGALELLKQKGYKLVSFTNSSHNAVRQQLKNAEIGSYFDENISVEDYGKFKPERDVYHWAARKLKVDSKDCMLVAAHGWDIAGALWAGWQGAFISRPGQQLFPLAPEPQFNESNLLTIVQKILEIK
jgi:2-haloacid dehalogenase